VLCSVLRYSIEDPSWAAGRPGINLCLINLFPAQPHLDSRPFEYTTVWYEEYEYLHVFFILYSFMSIFIENDISISLSLSTSRLWYQRKEKKKSADLSRIRMKRRQSHGPPTRWTVDDGRRVWWGGEGGKEE
jgi:hypothetical protein